MAIRPNIDSNSTELSIAEEIIGQPGVLPGALGADAVWWPLEPNEYDDFGAEYTLLSRRPINSSRQRKKGSVTDLDASGGFNQDLTNMNSQLLFPGFMYASYREKPSVSFTGVSATGLEVVDETDYAAGDLVFVSGSSVFANNGFKTVTGTDASPHEILISGLAVDASPSLSAKVVKVGSIGGAAGDIDVVVSGSFARYTSTTFDFLTLGLIHGEWFFVGGDGAGNSFSKAANNGFKRCYSVTANELVVDQSAVAMEVEANTTLTPHFYVGRVLKNELADLQVLRSYQLERKLGKPDTASNIPQSELLIGSFGDEFTLNIDQADKINIDWSFVGIGEEKRSVADGLKIGTRATIVEADAYNTSTDFNSMRLAIYNGVSEAPSPLFAYLLSLKVNIKNNVTVNKAVAVLGGFSVTLGLFEVSVEMNAYFSTVAAIEAIKDNENVCLYAAIAKNNAGVVWDMPLGALGDGRLDVKLDEAIMIPITMDAATAVAINPTLDYTLMWVFFDYLPTIAEA